jgi:diguanylate cyclase (GGDEF)-like protein
MNKFSLRQQLVLPFVFLVIFISAGIGWVSFRAGAEAVEDLTRRVLVDMVNRISGATERHLAGALTVLQLIAPDPATVPRIQPFSDDLASLERRFWAASGLFMEVNNYVYFGGEDGRFVGVNRVDKNFVELYLREPGASQRRVYAVQAAGDRKVVLRTDQYDPRVRPWYGVAAKQERPIWSPVYNDFTSREPTITLAKSVYRANRSLAGVVATDVTLKVLTDFLRTLTVSKNGVAFVMDGNGFMIATSGQELPFKMLNGAPVRMRAEEMQTKLIRDAYTKIREWQRDKIDLRTPMSREFSNPSGAIEIAAATLGERAGVDWVTVVAVPRSDFMGGVTRSFYQGILFAGFCVLIALILGLSVLNRMLGDIRDLTNAAKKVGNGEPLPALNMMRSDEIGQLAQTFSEMEHNLRIDRLTAVFNRESLSAQIGFLQRQAALKPNQPSAFALLFIDLDHFKSINDHHGHSAGDHVLMTVAARLKTAIRTSDVVARYGGDEFVVLLKGVQSESDVIAAEEKIRSVVEQPITLEHGVAQVGVSLGWSMFPQDGEDAQALIKIADSRMFETKKLRKAAR